MNIFFLPVSSIFVVDFEQVNIKCEVLGDSLWRFPHTLKQTAHKQILKFKNYAVEHVKLARKILDQNNQRFSVGHFVLSNCHILLSQGQFGAQMKQSTARRFINVLFLSEARVSGTLRWDFDPISDKRICVIQNLNFPIVKVMHNVIVLSNVILPKFCLD